MKKNNIRIRNKSEANINRFQCPSKYDKFVKIMRTPEFKTRQSLVTRRVMSRPEIRKRLSESAKKANKKSFSTSQKAILFLLYSKEELFLTDFNKRMRISKKELDYKLRNLFNRGYVDKVKSYNENSLKIDKNHFKYSLTSEGKVIVRNGLKDGLFNLKELENKFRRVEKKKEMTIDEFLLKENIGPNQFIILKAIQKSGPKFLIELASYLQISKIAIDKSLRGLNSREFLKREKNLNQNYEGSKRCRIQFLYTITNKCPILT